MIDLDRAVSLLRAGRLVAFPTETVFGLGGDAESPAALERIFSVKHRDRGKPLSVLVGPGAELEAWAAWSDRAQRLADALWPGPLTLVLPKRPRARDLLTGGADTLGLRMPDHPVPLSLLEAFGGPLAAPSANRSGSPSPTLAEHVAADLGAAVDLILPGRCAVGIESTVLLLGPPARIVRPGAVGREALEAALGEPVEEARAAAAYRTRAPLRLVEAAALDQALARAEGPVAVLSPARPGGCALWRPAAPDPPERAATLYQDLRALDQDGVALILVVLPPDRPEWALVRDRLAHAAHEGAPRGEIG
ncbi:MAG: threonylcarbamoyl-AMP synthase [Deltaproteobacteria bacterium]|nr:threonylcarbamoyl-AMP synthase [Deltaproteobacteria bacterium]